MLATVEVLLQTLFPVKPPKDGCYFKGLPRYFPQVPKEPQRRCGVIALG